jgi:hypothetical protein
MRHLILAIALCAQGCVNAQKTPATSPKKIDTSHSGEGLSGRKLVSEIRVVNFEGSNALSELDNGIWLFYEDCPAAKTLTAQISRVSVLFPSIPVGIVVINGWTESKNFPLDQPPNGIPWTVAIVDGELKGGFLGAWSPGSESDPYWSKLNQDMIRLLAISAGLIDQSPKDIPFAFKLNQLEFNSYVSDGRSFNNVKVGAVRAPKANLSKRSIFASSFRGANLSKADFSNSLLTGNDFSNADLSGARFDGAKLFNTTCPDGSLQKEGACNSQ